jgi:hypothetical protein
MVYHFCWSASEGWLVCVAIELHGLLTNPFIDPSRNIKVSKSSER